VSEPLAEALAERTAALCGLLSPIGEERALCDRVQAWATGRSPHLRRVGDSLVVGLDGAAARPGRPLVALCGHLDTVPVDPGDRAGPRREGTRLVAPGASDMKGGLALMMALAEALPAEERFCDLLLVFYAREEGPYLENELEAVLAEAPEVRQAALAICLEPTDNVVQLGCVGSIHATVTFRGRAAHSARPWEGENAVHQAGALLAELAARPPQARNVVPERCTLNLNFRFAPDRTVDEAAAELAALGARHGAEVTLTDRSPACPAFGEHPLVRRLLERTGAAAEPKQAWTDVARLAAHGVPAVNFGPGATAQAHQRGEWIEVSALARGHRLLERFLRR
jgi:succinyl-diaminopimelate desuccinylase